MMKKIIYTSPEGNLCVVTPVINTRGDEGLTEAQAEQRAWDKLPADAVNPVWVDASVIPSDRTFRNAWCMEDGKVGHDHAKCCEITKTRLRAERKPLLEAQDVLYMRAIEAGLRTDEIVTEKQRLRDVTKLVTESLTLDELKALNCNILGA